MLDTFVLSSFIELLIKVCRESLKGDKKTLFNFNELIVGKKRLQGNNYHLCHHC